MLTVCDYSDGHSKGGPCIRRKCEGYPLNFDYHSGLLALNRLDIPGNKSLALTSL